MKSRFLFQTLSSLPTQSDRQSRGMVCKDENEMLCAFWVPKRGLSPRTPFARPRACARPIKGRQRGGLTFATRTSNGCSALVGTEVLSSENTQLDERHFFEIDTKSGMRKLPRSPKHSARGRPAGREQARRRILVELRRAAAAENKGRVMFRLLYRRPICVKNTPISMTRWTLSNTSCQEREGEEPTHHTVADT